MFDPADLAAFAAAALVLIAIPGPDMLFVIAQGTAYGRAAGTAAGLGVAAGNLWHTALVTAGAAALVRTWPAAFGALKIAGVLYLLWLAWQATALALRTPAAGGNGAGLRVAPGARDGFRRGVVMNALNPKVALFFLAFLPQFADPARAPVWAQTAALGALFAAMVAAIYGPLGALAGEAGARLRQGTGGGAARIGRWLLAAVYAGLALRLAVEGA